MGGAHPPLVLASSAPWRGAVLRRLRLPFVQVPHRFEEVAEAGQPPEALARRFALGKARSVAATHPGALILGADQVATVGDTVLRKPRTHQETVARLRALSGRTHMLHSAVALVDTRTGEGAVHCQRVRLSMRLLGDDTIRRYVEAARPHGSVGGYRFEGLGATLFERVEGADDSAIVGLPLVEVSALLRGAGVDPLDAATARS
jgi:septum formation protein